MMKIIQKQNESNADYFKRIIAEKMAIIVRVDKSHSQIIDEYKYDVFSPGNGEYTDDEANRFVFIDVKYRGETFFELYKRILLTHKRATIQTETSWD